MKKVSNRTMRRRIRKTAENFANWYAAYKQDEASKSVVQRYADDLNIILLSALPDPKPRKKK
jgi:hypothetical protein